MKLRHQKRLAIIAGAATIFALAVFLLCQCKPSIREVRATIAVHGEAAATVPKFLESRLFSAHIRDISDFSGEITASAIPGTCLVEIALRDDSAAHAQAGMEAVLNRLSPVMGYISQDFSMEILLHSGVSELSSEDSAFLWLLVGAVVLLLVPVPKRKEELDLLEVLRRFGKLTRRFFILVTGLCLLVASGYYVYQKSTYVPSFEAAAVVSIGDYDPKTAPRLPAAVRGLLASELFQRHLESNCRISADAAAKSNLFTLTATAPTPESAQNTLDTVISQWPDLAVYAQNDLTLRLHQTTPPSNSPTNPFRPAVTLFKGFLLGLLCWTVCAFAAILFRQNIDTAPSKGYNKSQR